MSHAFFFKTWILQSFHMCTHTCACLTRRCIAMSVHVHYTQYFNNEKDLSAKFSFYGICWWRCSFKRKWDILLLLLVVGEHQKVSTTRIALAHIMPTVITLKFQSIFYYTDCKNSFLMAQLWIRCIAFSAYIFPECQTNLWNTRNKIDTIERRRWKKVHAEKLKLLSIHIAVLPASLHVKHSKKSRKSQFWRVSFRDTASHMLWCKQQSGAPSRASWSNKLSLNFFRFNNFFEIITKSSCFFIWNNAKDIDYIWEL